MNTQLNTFSREMIALRLEFIHTRLQHCRYAEAKIKITDLMGELRSQLLTPQSMTNLSIHTDKYISAPRCTTENNKHILVDSESPYYAVCDACGERFILMSEASARELNLHLLERPTTEN